MWNSDVSIQPNWFKMILDFRKITTKTVFCGSRINAPPLTFFEEKLKNFGFFCKVSRICHSNVPHCILRIIWCLWTHFKRYFDIWVTFASPNHILKSPAPPKWPSLALCALVKLGWGKVIFDEFSKLLPIILRCYLRYVEMSTGPIEPVSSLQT